MLSKNGWLTTEDRVNWAAKGDEEHFWGRRPEKCMTHKSRTGVHTRTEIEIFNPKRSIIEIPRAQ